MIFDPVKDIQDFHEKFLLNYDGRPRLLDKDISDFRIKFLLEELIEYTTCVEKADKLDALVDLVYVALGTSYLHGFDFREAWRRVHDANMKKVRCERPGDSSRGSTFDVIKPPGWQPPFLIDLV